MVHAHVSLVLLATWSITISSGFRGVAGNPPSPLEPLLGFVGNTSVLPPGWSGNSQCIADCNEFDSINQEELMLGPNFTDPVGLTIESCVAFCNQQGFRMAGLKVTECHCSNIYNPIANCFESDGNECFQACCGMSCPGNPVESCGIEPFDPPMYNIYYNLDSQFSCSQFVWPGGAPLTPGGAGWRFSYFYNDSVSARAMPRNAVNLPVPLPRGNLTVEACVAACGNAGYTLAGTEYADECYCGDVLESNSQPITDCSLLPLEGDAGTLMPCKGNAEEFCGGPDIIAIYTLPGTGLVPMIPFDPVYDSWCPTGNCVGSA